MIRAVERLQAAADGEVHSRRDEPIQDVGIEVRAVRPGHHAEFGMYSDTAEKGQIAKRMEHAVERNDLLDVHNALDAVIESDPQSVIAQRVYRDYVVQHRRQRRKRFVTSSPR